MIVKIVKLNDLAVLPKKAHDDDFCYDVTATGVEEVAENVYRYTTGLAMQIQRGEETIFKNSQEICEYEHETCAIVDFKKIPVNISIDCRSRSSIWKTGMILANSTGTVDEGYTGEISFVFYKVAPGEIYQVGDRIGQIKLGFTLSIDFVEVDSLGDTTRGDKGFGSTGNK